MEKGAFNNSLVTGFWQKAAQSLPAPYRARYHAYFESAERFDLLLDALFNLFSNSKTGLPRRPSGPLASSSSSG